MQGSPLLFRQLTFVANVQAFQHEHDLLSQVRGMIPHSLDIFRNGLYVDTCMNAIRCSFIN